MDFLLLPKIDSDMTGIGLRAGNTGTRFGSKDIVVSRLEAGGVVVLRESFGTSFGLISFLPLLDNLSDEGLRCRVEAAEEASEKLEKLMVDSEYPLNAGPLESAEFPFEFVRLEATVLLVRMDAALDLRSSSKKLCTEIRSSSVEISLSGK